MALSSLAGLRAVALGPRTDRVGDFADYLKLAEQRMYYGGSNVAPLRVLPMETSTTLTFANGTTLLPADFLDKRALIWGSGLQAVTLSYLPPSVHYTSVVTSGPPTSYTMEGKNLILNSASSGTAKLLYWAKLPTLTTDNDTNAILDNWPGIYLFGTQIELHRTLRDDNEMTKAFRMYADAVSAANAQTIIARTYGGPIKRRLNSIGA